MDISTKETPIFRLEGIIKTKDDFEDFEGPLILILQLLSKDKVEIRDISISDILDQYLKYLDRMAELNLDIASEFVTMASHLTYIKTKMLLSGAEEVSELEQLMVSLEELQRGGIYLQIKSLSETLSGMYTHGAAMLPSPPEYLPPVTDNVYVHTEDEILDAILRLIGRENIKIGSINPNEPVYPARIVYSISDMTDEILDRLRKTSSLSLKALFYESRDRAELVAMVVAVLELCKLGSIYLIGDEDDFVISYRS